MEYWFWIVIGLLSAFAVHGMIEFAGQLRLHFKPPKPRKYHIQLHAPDGYPLRNYPLTEEQVARVLTLLEHDDLHRHLTKGG